MALQRSGKKTQNIALEKLVDKIVTETLTLLKNDPTFKQKLTEIILNELDKEST